MPDKVLTEAERKANQRPLTFVKDWLRFRGQTQRKLAETLGVSEGNVSKWLKGTQPVTIAHFTAIAVFLNAEPAELLAAPPDRDQSIRYRKIAEVAKDIPPEALDEWLALGKRLRRQQSD